MRFVEIVVNSGITGFLGWYLKHRIDLNAQRQLESLIEDKRATHARFREELRAELDWVSEVKKIRFASIYERRINALLDVYAAVQRYEIAIGEVSREVNDNNAREFDARYDTYCNKRDTMNEVFWCNAALFDRELIGSFREYRKLIQRYDNAYSVIVRTAKNERSYAQLPKLEYEQGPFSIALKGEVERALNDS